MMTAISVRAPIASPISRANRIRSGILPAGLFQRNPIKWRCAAAVALVFFLASLALAPALTRARDQKKLASEINAKTLKAAAALKTSPRLPLRVSN